DLQRFLARVLYLFVLGYLIAHWGGQKVTLIRRLKLLREIATLSTARMGVDALIDSTIERLRAFYDVDIYLVILADAGTADYRLHRLKRYQAVNAGDGLPMREELLRVFVVLPEERAVFSSEALFGGRRAHFPCNEPRHEVIENPADERTAL